MGMTHQGQPPEDIDTLPPTNSDNHPVVEPLTILDWKWDTIGVSPSKLVLVQWLGLALKDTTWEHQDDLKLQYHLEDKVIFSEKGVVSKTAHEHKPQRIRNKLAHIKDQSKRDKDHKSPKLLKNLPKYSINNFVITTQDFFTRIQLALTRLATDQLQQYQTYLFIHPSATRLGRVTGV